MKNQAVNSFIIETVLVNPIEDIILKLKNNNFRDCDVKWLSNKLKGFTSFALETLDKKFDMSDVEIGSGLMNEFVKDRFLRHFNVLLKYFKSF